MLHFRPDEADWAMVTAYFVQLILQESVPVWYANGDKYKIHWADVEQVLLVLLVFIRWSTFEPYIIFLFLFFLSSQVFMPINEKDKHWFVAHFHIKTGVVTFYDSGGKHEPEWRPWYINMRAYLEVKLNKFNFVHFIFPICLK